MAREKQESGLESRDTNGGVIGKVTVMIMEPLKFVNGFELSLWEYEDNLDFGKSYHQDVIMQFQPNPIHMSSCANISICGEVSGNPNLDVTLKINNICPFVFLGQNSLKVRVSSSVNCIVHCRLRITLLTPVPIPP